MLRSHLGCREEPVFVVVSLLAAAQVSSGGRERAAVSPRCPLAMSMLVHAVRADRRVKQKQRSVAEAVEVPRVHERRRQSCCTPTTRTNSRVDHRGGRSRRASLSVEQATETLSAFGSSLAEDRRQVRVEEAHRHTSRAGQHCPSARGHVRCRERHTTVGSLASTTLSQPSLLSGCRVQVHDDDGSSVAEHVRRRDTFSDAERRRLSRSLTGFRDAFCRRRQHLA